MKTNITICMGSSCFSRGNRENLALLRAYLNLHNIDAAVTLAGCRCKGQCTKGPVLRIDDRLFCGVDRGMLIDLLNQYLRNLKEGAHGASASGLQRGDRVPGLPQVHPPLSGQSHPVPAGAGLRRS